MENPRKSKTMNRLIVFLALLFIAFVSLSASFQEEKVPPENRVALVDEASQTGAQPEIRAVPSEEEIKKLEDYSKETEECLKECGEIEKKIQRTADEIQNLVKQQWNLKEQLFQTTHYYNETFDMCKITIFKDNKERAILAGDKDENDPEIQEMGGIIPRDCQQTLIQVKKDIASALNQLAELLSQTEAPQKEIKNIETQIIECLKNCEEVHDKGYQTSEKIKKLMEQEAAPLASIGALARYDAARERMKRKLKLSHDGKFIRKSNIESSKKIAQTLISYKPPLWGIPINKKINWPQLGFSNLKSIAKAVAPYSAGLYIPVSVEKSFREGKAGTLPSSPKLIQQIHIPRHVKIITPDIAIAGMPISLSILNEREVPLPGIIIETDAYKTFKSDETGKVHITSLTGKFDFASLWVPGTSQGNACIRFSNKIHNISEQETSIQIDSFVDIVLLGSIADVYGIGFDGFSESTEISIAGRSLNPLAESPVFLKFRIPEDITPGSYTVIIKEKFKEPAHLPILCIKLDLNANNAGLKKGESIIGRVNVEGTEKPLLVELINDSPSEISIDPHLVPVKDGKGEFEIKGLKSGPFRITVGDIEFSRK